MGRVKHRISNLVVTREGYNIKAEWRVPPEMVDKDNPDRATWIDIYCDFNPVFYPNQGRKGVGQSDGSNEPITYIHADRFWIRGQNTGDSVIKNFSRTRYHPCTNLHTDGKYYSQLHNYCTTCKIGVFGGNAGGMNSVGPTVWATYNFYKPRAPKISWVWDSGNLTLTVDTDPGDDNYERYDTMINVTFKTADGTTFGAFPGFNNGWFSTQSTSYEHTFNLSPYMGSLIEGKVVSIKCEAYARGMAGDSATITSQRNVALPIAATIGEVSVDRKAPTGRIKVAVSPGGWTTTVQLQRRHGEDGSWEDVSGALDNGSSTALYDSYGGAAPVDGEYIYYRVKSWRDYGDFTVYSAAKRADCLFTAKTPPACNATVGLPALRPGDDGTSFDAVMAWTDSTANEGCELSYSTNVNAWDSSDGPTTVEYTSADAQKDASAEGFAYSRTVTVSGLTANETYYVDMRRYRTVDGEKCYSKYAGRATVVMESAANDKCGFVSIEPQGTSATLLIGINETGTNAGTEVTWSDYEGAWESNEQPNKLEATWGTAGASGDWGKTQTVRLRGLEPGRTYYVRARRYDSNGAYGAYGVGSFRTGTAASSLDLRCGIMSIEGGDDGKSAVVVVGWSGDRDGCEVSWSTDPNAWESNEQPSSGEFEWEDAENQGFEYVHTTDTSPIEGKTYYQLGPTVPPAYIYYIPVENPSAEDMQYYYELVQLWSHTGTYYLRGLEDGQTYYVKARTYADSSSGKAYSDYSEAVTVTPYSAPESVSLTAPEAVARGQAIELWWTIQSDMEQTDWRVREVGLPFAGSLVAGSGSLCRASVPADRYRDLDEITMLVEASCGGGFTSSNDVTVAIVEAPPCEVYVPHVLDAQPMSFSVYTDATASELLCTCQSCGVSLDAPDGSHDQVDGDVVWTEAAAPALLETTWGETDLRAALVQDVDDAEGAVDAAQDAVDGMEPDDEGYAIAVNALEAAESRLAACQAALAEHLAAHDADDPVHVATVEMPRSALVDGGNYSIRVSAVESVAGMRSAAAEARFSVAYAHQAPEPSAEIIPDVDDRSVVISLSEPDGYAEGDVYDIYRMTPSGYELAAGGVAVDKQVIDKYAPIGGDAMAYAVCTRTVDGDISYREFPYALPVRVLRFDWDGGSVELPYNIEIRDRYSKSFEARKHADGSVSGYFDQAVDMTGGYSSETLRVEDPDAVRMLRALGDYAGACFCRTPDGDAFQCNVDVSELGGEVDGFSEVSLDVTRVRLTAEFHAGDKPADRNQEG